MDNIKSSINMKNVRNFINRTIYNSPDQSEINNIILYKDEVNVYKKGQISFITIKTIAEEMQDNNLRVTPGNSDTIIISFNVNSCKYREYELPKYDLKPIEYYQDKMINVLDYKFEEVFKNNRYNYLYTYKDEKIKEYATPNLEKPIKEFYCLAKPDKPRTSSVWPPFLVCKAFIYYTEYNRYQEKSSISIRLEILDKKLHKRYNNYLPNWSVTAFFNVFPRNYGDMCVSMFNITENIKFYERNIAQSIMVFDTLEEAQDMCNKVNEYYNIYCLKMGWHI